MISGSRRWRFFGLGESQIAEVVERLDPRDCSIHYTARFPEVHLYVPFGTIREIHGRSVDYFPLPDGRLLHPYELSMNIPDRWPWVRRYQLVQERRDLIRMRIEAYSAPPSDREIADVRAVAADLLGPDVVFEVEMVERLGADANGKFRVSRTLVPREDGER